MPRGDIDPVYLDSPYYLYPDGAIAVKALRVISGAMTASGVAGIGRLTLSRRERMVRTSYSSISTMRCARGSRLPG